MKKILALSLILFELNNFCLAQTTLLFNDYVKDYLIPTGFFGLPEDTNLYYESFDEDYNPAKIITSINNALKSNNVFYTFHPEIITATSPYTNKLMGFFKSPIYEGNGQGCELTPGIKNSKMGVINCSIIGEEIRYGSYAEFRNKNIPLLTEQVNPNIRYMFTDSINITIPNPAHTGRPVSKEEVITAFFGKLIPATTASPDGVELGGRYQISGQIWAYGLPYLGYFKKNLTFKGLREFYTPKYDWITLQEIPYGNVTIAGKHSSDFSSDNENVEEGEEVWRLEKDDMSWPDFAHDYLYYNADFSKEFSELLLASLNIILGKIPFGEIKSFNITEAEARESLKQQSETLYGWYTDLEYKFENCTITYGNFATAETPTAHKGSMICEANLSVPKYGIRTIHNQTIKYDTLLKAEFAQMGISADDFRKFSDQLFLAMKDNRGNYIHIGENQKQTFFGKFRYSKESSLEESWSFVGGENVYLSKDWEKEDFDTDGVQNGIDQCPNYGIAGKIITDVISEYYGCLDSDNDKVADTLDNCPETPPGSTVTTDGCPDDDGDGAANSIDICPNTPQGTPVATNGCPDADSDGVIDIHDVCPNTPPGASVNLNGCPDTDDDGVADSTDLCPNTPPNANVNSDGCSDSDGDGIEDSIDICPNTPTGAAVNATGCPDSDNDGVADPIDICPNTPPGSTVTTDGCPDDDGDGVKNTTDLCPNTPPGSTVTSIGCVISELTHAGTWNPSGGRSNTSASNPRFRFTVDVTGPVTIQMLSTSDSYIYLLNTNNGILSEAAGINAKIERSIEGPNTYEIVAATPTAGVTNTFFIKVTGYVSNLTIITPLIANGNWINSGGQNATSTANPHYKFTVNTGGNASNVIINLTSTTQDSYIYLLNSSGGIITRNDDFNGNNAGLIISLLPGTYEIVAATYSTGVTGDFKLDVTGVGTYNLLFIEPPPPPPLTTLTQNGNWNVSKGRSTSGNPGYKFTVGLSGTVTIDLTSVADNYLYLLNSSGSIVSQSDNGAGGTNARITTTLSTGTYTAIATTYNSEVAGDYTISVTGYISNLIFIAPPPTLTQNNTWATTTGRSTNGNPGYRFTVDTAGPITIDLTSVPDNYLYLLGSGGSIVSQADSGAGGTNARITTTLSTGTYTAIATTYNSGESGTYKLDITGYISNLTYIPPPPPPPPTTTLTQNGNWNVSGGQNATSTANPRYQFTVDTVGVVTIYLNSIPDNYLYLLNNTNGIMTQNDDSVSTNARIILSLSPGTYKIVAATYSPGATATFTLTVNGYVSNLILSP